MGRCKWKRVRRRGEYEARKENREEKNGRMEGKERGL